MSGSLPAFVARRLALLLFTLVLVPSLSFVMFTLIQGDHTGPLDVLEELGNYLAAVFLQGDVGDGTFRNDTFIRTQSALNVVKSGFLVDVYLLVGAIAFAVVAGILAGSIQAVRPHSRISRAISIGTALALASPVYFVGLMLLLLFSPGVGAVAEIPFLSTVAGYRAPSSDPVAFVRNLWMPCVIIGAPLAGACTRMTASQLSGTLHEDFVRTARAKGVKERRVVCTTPSPRRRPP